MAIAFKAAAVTNPTTGATSMSATLPTYVAGDLLVLLFAKGDTSSGEADPGGLTGWTAAFTTVHDGTTTGYYSVYYRIADGTEGTSLSLTWTTSAKPMAVISSYSGVDGTTPIVAAAGAIDAVNDATVRTPTVNNTGTGVEWAVMLAAYRTTVTGNKSNTFTPDAALTERADANESANPSAAWVSCEVADSNAAVAAGNHQYNATIVSGGSSSHKFGALLYLNPASSGSALTQNVNDSVTMSDALAFGPGLGLSDSVTMSDALGMGVGLSLTEAVALADAISLSPGISLADSVTMSDALSFGYGLGIDDSVTMADAIAFGVGLALSDSVTMSDSITPALNGGATNWTQNVNDNVAIADAISFGYGLAMNDNVTMADAIASGMGLSLADSVALADALSLGPGLGLSESVPVADAVTFAPGSGISDAVTVSDHVSILLNGQPWPAPSTTKQVHRINIGRFGIY